MVDEHRVGADRDVVQEETAVGPPDVDPALGAVEGVERGLRLRAVEAEVAREVVAGAERDADEREPALEGRAGDGGHRAVAAGCPEHAGVRLSRERGCVLARSQDVRVDAARRRRGAELVDAGAVAGAGIDEQPAAHGARRVLGVTARKDGPIGS